MSTSSVAICTICLADANPTFQDLQSITACGHVYHELCLQSWMQESPAGRGHACPGRRHACPLCKQSYTIHDVHRLYFEFVESDSTQPQISPSKNLQTAMEDPKHRKLDAAMTFVYEQFKELDSQVAVNLRRAEKAEAATAVARSELARCIQHLKSVQEELKREREMVQKIRRTLLP